MNSCRTVQDLMEQARDECLPALVQAALDSHLGSCPDCARLAVLEAELNEGFAALRADAGDLDMPEDFRLQVKKRLLLSGRSSVAGPSHWASGFTMGLAAAACVVLTVVAVFALRGEFSREQPLRIVGQGTPNSSVGHQATALSEPFLLDARTAPLLYATPEVEVIFDGTPQGRAGSPSLRPAAAEAEDEADEPLPGSGRREYHF